MRSAAVSILLFAVACGPSSSGPDAGGGEGNGEGPDASPWDFPDAREIDEFADAAPTEQCDKMDILFVVDNSGSMGEEQDNLAANFPGFIQVLEDYSTELDYRVGITTTGVDYEWTMQTPLGPIPEDQDGNDGALLQECDMTRRWVQQDDPDPAGTFACAAEVGSDGPNKEMPLRALELAFSDRIDDSTNVGFRRDDALLALVILTDEDDCSYEDSVDLGFAESLCDSQMEPVSTYLDFLDQFTGDRGRWATAVIAGPGPGDCSSEFGNADEASRLGDFVDQTGQNAVFSSICAGDLTVGLADALETFDSACQAFPPID